MSNIKGKVIIITGASAGIGLATARKLVQEGAKLMLVARRQERLEEIVQNFPQAKICYFVADVANEEEMKKAVEKTIEIYGRVDILFNNAGIMPVAPLSQGRIQEWKQMLDINVLGVLNGIAAVLPIMKNQQSGHILTTASVAGHVVFNQGAVYCGTKFAVRAIMEGLRKEERESNIRSTLISPGTVETELHHSINIPEMREKIEKLQEDIGLKAEDVADAAIYAMATPEHVSISEIIMRPTQQVD